MLRKLFTCYFINQKKKIHLDNHHIRIGDSFLSRVDNCKFLGIIIDQHLTFKPHIQYLINKISKNIGIISHIRRFITSSIAVTLYYSFIFPYLNYCNLVWACNYPSYLLPLLKHQKRYISIALDLPYNSHTDHLFKKLKILKVHQINHHHTVIFMYKLDYHMLPYLYNELIVTHSPLHSYALRSIPKYKSSFAKSNTLLHSITCSGPKIYSKIPAIIFSQPNLSSFKRMLKHFIINSPSFLWHLIHSPSTNNRPIVTIQCFLNMVWVVQRAGY